MGMPKDNIITLQVPMGLKAAAIRVAEAEHRSLEQLCTELLVAHLETRGEWPESERSGFRRGIRRLVM